MPTKSDVQTRPEKKCCYSLARLLLLVVHRADAPAVAVVLGAAEAVASGALGVVGEPVSESGLADARKASKLIDAVGVSAAIVKRRIGALVQVRHAGDRVQRTVHVQVAVSDIVAPGLRRKKKRVRSVSIGTTNRTCSTAQHTDCKESWTEIGANFGPLRCLIGTCTESDNALHPVV